MYKYRYMIKEAKDAGGFLNMLSSGGKALFGLGTDIGGKYLTALALGAPVGAAALAFLAAKATSPYAVAENSKEIALNAIERESLAQSMRDLEEIRLRKKLTNKPNIHDQYI